jgi:hypothetical protein
MCDLRAVIFYILKQLIYFETSKTINLFHTEKKNNFMVMISKRKRRANKILFKKYKMGKLYIYIYMGG